MKLYLEIGHNRTTRKKGNPKISLEAESCKIAPFFCNHIAIIASGAQGAYLSPLPVGSLDFDTARVSFSLCSMPACMLYAAISSGALYTYNDYSIAGRC